MRTDKTNIIVKQAKIRNKNDKRFRSITHFHAEAIEGSKG